MTTELEYLSQNLYCIRSELLTIVNSIQGCYTVLVGNVPEFVVEALNQIGSISENLRLEIHPFPQNKIDLQSLGNAVVQLQSLANKWEKDALNITFLVNKIKTMDAHSGNTDFEKIIEIISNDTQKFLSYVQHIKMVQAEHLTQNYGFAKILNIDI